MVDESVHTHNSLDKLSFFKNKSLLSSEWQKRIALTATSNPNSSALWMDNLSLRRLGYTLDLANIRDNSDFLEEYLVFRYTQQEKA